MEKKITVGVAGMHCASCAKIIENELKKDKNIKEININPLTEQAEITSYEDLDQKDINKKLKKLGYQLLFAESPTENKLTALKQQKFDELNSQKN